MGDLARSHLVPIINNLGLSEHLIIVFAFKSHSQEGLREIESVDICLVLDSITVVKNLSIHTKFVHSEENKFLELRAHLDLSRLEVKIELAH